jgi:hypothetical protein
MCSNSGWEPDECKQSLKALPGAGLRFDRLLLVVHPLEGVVHGADGGGRKGKWRQHWESSSVRFCTLAARADVMDITKFPFGMAGQAG